ncbi:alpha/beta-hydrolase [Rhizoctonia solani]|nr:alpha/beta-hydrolase [Rhizoctonia solani]
MLLPGASSLLFTASSLVYLASLVLAAPLPQSALDKSVAPLSSSAIAAYSFYTNFVAATYCSVTKEWVCSACELIPGFVPFALGGDGGAVPYWYVGWWPAGSTVVVAHQGTDPLEIRALITDAKFIPSRLSTTLFPNVSSEIKVHSGFKQAQAASAPQILAAVKRVLADRNSKSVTVVGHSLGGAIAALDALYLKLNLPSNIAIKGVTYGQPRVGNPEFANWFDQTINDFSRVTNKKDVIPILPGRFLGFRHSSGEKHIKSKGKWYACEGQDNTSSDCSVGEVPNILKGNLIDHLGPYEDIWVGSLSC